MTSEIQQNVSSSSDLKSSNKPHPAKLTFDLLPANRDAQVVYSQRNIEKVYYEEQKIEEQPSRSVLQEPLDEYSA